MGGCAVEDNAGETLTPRFGTSENFSQQLGFNPDASERSLHLVFVNFKSCYKMNVRIWYPHS